MRIFTLILFFACSSFTLAFAAGSLKGQVQDPAGEPVAFANLALYSAADSSLYKVEISDEAGVFQFRSLAPGGYTLEITYVGLATLRKTNIQVNDQQLDLGVLTMQSAVAELTTATVTASRSIVEVKPDRTVFNVEGTINSVGTDAVSLLRMAPGVTVDNNENINVMGRSGVLIYVDGKRLPLSGQDLSNYLQNLPAEQIDRIDIITNPGARYEAEGNAGIIDIRLKKDKNQGANGSLSSTYSQGRYSRLNSNLSANFRNRFLNAFGTAGWADGESFNRMVFSSTQNGIFLDEKNRIDNGWENYNYRLGLDFFLADQHTLGVLIGGRQTNGDNRIDNRIGIAGQPAPAPADSVLAANTLGADQRTQETYNLNYRYDNSKGRVLNIDLDYGKYRNDSRRAQTNRYFSDDDRFLSEIINDFDTPTDIDIYTFNADFEEKMLGGVFSAGTKLSRVVSDNSFLVYDVLNDIPARNDSLSNRFEYTENVYAGYLSFARPLGEKWDLVVGLRAEQTDATGDLQAFRPELQEPPVDLNYLSWFPNAGLTWQIAPQHSLALSYGRRINRPDYNVLNPFNNQLSQLSYEKGNPFLRPEIVNNLELGYTLAYRYNFKLAYSLTTDQITRLIAPDEERETANFITWDNLDEQTIVSFNASAPVQFSEGWNAYFNFSASYLDNQADYGEGARVDVQAFTYSIYQQQTFDLPGDFKGEISGYFAGPGVWGGVFEYETSWSLNLGLQHQFLNDRLNAKLSVNDLFYESGWDGVSSFDGLESRGSGRWDSRRATLSLSYRFGNENVKSRKRKTGLEEEAERVGG